MPAERRLLDGRVLSVLDKASRSHGEAIDQLRYSLARIGIEFVVGERRRS